MTQESKQKIKEILKSPAIGYEDDAIADKLLELFEQEDDIRVKVEKQDIRSIIGQIGGGIEPQKIINYIKEYIYDPEIKVKKQGLK